MRHGRPRARVVIAGALATLLTAGAFVALTPSAAVAADPLPNPEIPAQCGLGVTLVLDASGSVQQSNAVGAVRSAAEAFLSALSDTGSTARVIQFGSLSQQLAPRATVDAASLAPGGVFRGAVDGYYNPIPPRPSNVEIKRYNSGSPSSASSWSAANSNTQYTNWDQSLAQTATDAGDLVVYVTDGDPTAYDFNQPGDPFSPGPPPDVGTGTDRNAQVAAVTLDRAVTRANQVKQTGARVLALGVGEALQNQASVDRLIQISGPDVARTVGEFDIEVTDVALIRDFDNLGDAVRGLVLELCSPSLTIRKFAQSETDAAYLPADGWPMTVTPSVPGGFDWILPNGATGPSATVTTTGGGFAQFQWEPRDETDLSAAAVSEQLQAGFSPGRPGPANDYRCEFRNADGDVRVVTGELTDGGATASFSLSGIGDEIGTCSVYNSFDYAPEIALTKVNSPTSVRGDLSPPAVVRSDYVATNPGNTPLAAVSISDDRCAPVVQVTAPPPDQAFNVGDANRNALLDPGESWEAYCDRGIRTSGTQAVAGTNIVNTAEVQGTDPAGTVVTDTATDDVDAFVPLIGLTKLVDGAKSVTIASGASVDYTYAVENLGNTPLAPVVLADDTPPCETPTRGADISGNGDAVLDVGETWSYSCSASPTTGVVNTATVTGVPLDPTTGAAFPSPNPLVSAVDTAEVVVLDPSLSLVKTVDQSVVFPGTTVTYSYAATNTGSADLRNDTGDAGWVADDRCAPVAPVLAGAFNVGDVNTDDLLNPGETWSFTCQTAISDLTVNIATIVAQPVAGGTPVGSPLTRRDVAIVEIVSPGIDIVKTALVPVVLDPSADPLAGPDFPTPRSAEYLYEVENTGTVPLRDVAPTDDRCAPLVLSSGDTDADLALDPSEVWVYTCSTQLSRAQATPPPVGAESGLVTNTASVSGTPFLPEDPSVEGPVQTATDSAQVLVIQPGLSITKTASADAVRVGTAVTYTFEVTNTGDVGLLVIGPADDKCSPLTFDGGDTNGNDLLDGANSGAPETWTYTCTRALGLPAEPDTADVNEVAVLGVDPLGNIYGATDTAEVVVLDPAIALTKSVSDHLVLVGSEVTYSFGVTNVGRSPVAADDVLIDVTLLDVAQPSQPSCETPSLVSKTGGDQDDALQRDPPELWTYDCTAVVSAPTLNIAAVIALGGSTFGLEIPVAAFAGERVQTFDPRIEVTKTANPTTTTPGGRVTYTYEVRNTGDVPLAGVAERIADDTCSPVGYVSGDIDGDGLLDTPNSIFEDSLDETWVFTCSTTVRVTTVNTVVVTGTAVDSTGEPLCDTPVAAVENGPTCEPTDQAQAIVKVSAISPLPPTGGTIMWSLLALGGVLAALGAALVRVSRRARSII
ncbi:hypothetical protein ACFQ0P_01215 [Microbacterium insulae]|uniref:VWFA domain-containing protein n=1 Tax=Microbacterium insulae TaxID=483014 RepID=A0ABW3ADQ4_9MICO